LEELAMSYEDPNRREIQPDDALRLNRLSEEVRGRLTEMAFIVARITGVEYDGGPVRKFVPRGAVQMQADAPPKTDVELVEITPELEACYGWKDGRLWVDCPCGTPL
jgi:hypothetical protein